MIGAKFVPHINVCRCLVSYRMASSFLGAVVWTTAEREACHAARRTLQSSGNPGDNPILVVKHVHYSFFVKGK